MKWRIHRSITAMPALGSNPDNLRGSPFYVVGPSFIFVLVLSSLKTIKCVS